MRTYASEGRQPMEGTTRILVVDDDVDFTNVLAQGLRGEGYGVEVVNDPGRALAKAEAFQPHLILLDVVMPETDGGDLAQAFRESPVTRSVPILFLTSTVSEQDVESRGGKIGGEDFLAKPVTLRRLAAEIRKHLRKPGTLSGPKG